MIIQTESFACSYVLPGYLVHINLLGYNYWGGICTPTFEEIRNSIKPFIDEYGIKRVGVFGSYARGQAKESSDIDLLFDFQKEFGIFGLSRLKLCLEARFGKGIDILEFTSIDPLIRDSILKDMVVIYEQG